MEIINPNAIRAITDDRLRTADAARLVAACRPPSVAALARRRFGRSRPGRAPIFGRLHLARS